jgi:hypothetical protein
MYVGIATIRPFCMLLASIYIHRFSLHYMVQADCNKTSLLQMRQEMILYLNMKIEEK